MQITMESSPSTPSPSPPSLEIYSKLSTLSSKNYNSWKSNCKNINLYALSPISLKYIIRLYRLFRFIKKISYWASPLPQPLNQLHLPPSLTQKSTQKANSSPIATKDLKWVYMIIVPLSKRRSKSSSKRKE
jgi:hypothetical protein